MQNSWIFKWGNIDEVEFLKKRRTATSRQSVACCRVLFCAVRRRATRVLPASGRRLRPRGCRGWRCGVGACDVGESVHIWTGSTGLGTAEATWAAAPANCRVGRREVTHLGRWGRLREPRTFADKRRRRRRKRKKRPEPRGEVCGCCFFLEGKLLVWRGVLPRNASLRRRPQPEKPSGAAEKRRRKCQLKIYSRQKARLPWFELFPNWVGCIHQFTWEFLNKSS